MTNFSKIILLVLTLWPAVFMPSPAYGQAEYYTIMVGSYHSLNNAEADYQTLQKSVLKNLLMNLRIEKSGQYYTVRLGKFPEKAPAQEVLPKVRHNFKDARILRAFYKPERIVKLFTGAEGLSITAEAVASKTESPVVSFRSDKKTEEKLINKSAGHEIKVIAGRPMKLANQTQLKFIAPGIINSLQGKEFFTLQAGSFSSRDLAGQQFDNLLQSNEKNKLIWLRIERIQGFYTVRVGKFQDKTDALNLRQLLKRQNSPTRLLQAYIKPERIIKIFTLGFGQEKEGKEIAPGQQFSVKIIRPMPDQVKTEAGSRQIVTKVIESRKHKVRIIGHLKDVETVETPLRGEEFFTLQMASFTDQKLALLAYNRLVADFPKEQLPELRIELVHGYYTVRIGKFTERSKAADFASAFKTKYPRLVVLQAYIINTRIVKSAPDKNNEAVVLVDKEQPLAPENEDNTAGKSDSGSLEKLSEAGAPETAQPLLPTVGAEQQHEITKKAENKAEKGKDTGHEPAEEKQGEPSAAQVALNPVISQAEEKNGLIVPPAATLSKQVSAVGRGEAEKVNKEEPVRGIFPDENNASAKFSYEIVKVIEKDDRGKHIKMPSSLFFDRQRGELYVINGVNNRIIVYGPDYFPQNSLGQGRGIDSPMGGYVAPDGKIYITQTGMSGSGPRLTILNNAFLPEKEIMMADMPNSRNFTPQKITINQNGKLYITGLHSKRVLVLDSSGAFVEWFQVAIDKKGDYFFSELNKPTRTTYIRDVKSDHLGNLFFLSEETSKIYVFNERENFLFSFGVKGGAEGKMSRPRGLAIDENKRCIYVVDYMRHTVLIYDFTGKFRYEFGGRGWGAEWFNYPVGIEVGVQGQVIVADFFNQQVKAFETHWQGSFPERPSKLWRLTVKE